MTNKLPIVGKRYRFKHYKTPYPEVEVLAITNSYAVYLGKDKHGFDAVGHCGKLVFLQDYEELPEDKAETKPSIFNEIRNLYELKYNDLDPHIEDIVKLNELAIEETKNEIISAFDEIFPKKNGESNFCDKAETRPETQSLELSPEVKKAIKFLRLETNLFEKVGEILDESLINTLKVHHKHLAIASKNLLNALDKQFKVNETSESVGVKEEEVKEKEEEEFFSAFAGKLIEYQGKRYVCISQTQYLPNERPDDWKECDYSSPEYTYTKIKFRDIFFRDIFFLNLET